MIMENDEDLRSDHSLLLINVMRMSQRKKESHKWGFWLGLVSSLSFR